MSAEIKKVSCLLVHGWGMNRRVWQPLVEKLPPWVDVHLMDLPGHGDRTGESLSNLCALADDVKAQCIKIKKPAQPLMLVGWSLGGLACLQLAINQCAEVDALMLVSCNPCFVKKQGWPWGVDGQVFNQFAESLNKDFSGTIRRFLSLQVKGSESGRLILRGLRDKILQQPQPADASLQAGLDILQQVDLRHQLKQIKQPMSWLLGSQDGLVPAGLADEIKQVQGAGLKARVLLIDKAGHAPFLSHPDIFLQQLLSSIQAL